MSLSLEQKQKLFGINLFQILYPIEVLFAALCTPSWICILLANRD
jgi:hypothetical protein